MLCKIQWGEDHDVLNTAGSRRTHARSQIWLDAGLEGLMMRILARQGGSQQQTDVSPMSTVMMRTYFSAKHEELIAHQDLQLKRPITLRYEPRLHLRREAEPLPVTHHSVGICRMIVVEDEDIRTPFGGAVAGYKADTGFLELVTCCSRKGSAAEKLREDMSDRGTGMVKISTYEDLQCLKVCDSVFGFCQCLDDSK